MLILIIASLGFGGGYWCRGRDAAAQAEMEDYALRNVLSVVSYHQYALRGDLESLRELLDVNMNDHLSRARRHAGVIEDDAFLEARIRILNAAGALWEKYPPFESKQWETYTYKSRLHETASENLQLLEWAKAQCSANPDLNCRSSSPAAQKDAQ